MCNMGWLVWLCKHREGRLKQEMDNMRQQNDWLNKELQERIQELMTSRKEKVSYAFPNYYYYSFQVLFVTPG